MSSQASLDTLDGFLRNQLDVLITIRDNMPMLEKIALQYTTVADVEDFKAQVAALNAALPVLMDASQLILKATPAGIALLLAADVPAQRVLLGIGTAGLMAAEAFASAASFAALQLQVNQLAVNITGLAQGLGTYASQTALDALAARVNGLETSTGLQAQINQLKLDLQNGLFNTALAARVTALEAKVAGLEGAGSLTAINAELLRLAGLINGLGIRIDGQGGTLTSLTFRITTVETANESSVAVQISLSARLSTAEGNITAQSTATQLLSVRVTSTENGIIAESLARTALESKLNNNIAKTDANATAVQTLQTTVSSLGGKTDATSLALTTLSSRVTNTETGLTGAANATSALSTRVTLTESGLTSQAASITALESSLSGSGNLLPNSAFEVDLRGWEIYTRGLGWELPLQLIHKLDPGSLPAGVGTLGVHHTGTPAGNIGIRTIARVPIAGRQRHIVSAYMAAVNCRAELHWRVFNAAGVEIDFGIAGTTVAAPTTNLDTCARVFAVVPAPLAGAEIQLQWWVMASSGLFTKAWLFRPMLEAATPLQNTPSPWVPGSSGMDQALASAVTTLNTRVDQTNTTVTAQSSSITALQSQVSLAPKTYVQTTPPVGGTYRTGDLWLDSDDGHKQYVWSGTAWVASASQATVIAQDEPPPAPQALGTIWLDTNDNNKMYRWNGTAWVDASDQRITANANATQALTTRVTATENSITSQAGSITTLTSRIDDPATGLVANAGAINSLTTRVSNAEGVNTSQATSITNLNSSISTKTTTFAQINPPATTGRVVGDLWIDTDDSNKIYTWDGTAWVIRPGPVATGGKTFAQISAPTSGMSAGDLWFDTDDSNKEYRFDGTSWILIADNRITVNASAISSLDTRVTNAEGVNSSQATSITNLNSNVAAKTTTYVQVAAPSTAGRVVGDMWISSGDNNKLYVWNGTAWESRVLEGGVRTFAQIAAPTAGMRTSDLWFDTDDNNKMYRYDGTAWNAVDDGRILANASAITSLTTRVTNTENTNTAQATSITNLNSSVANKNTILVQGTAPAVGIVNDMWVDSANGNKIYTSNGTAWVLRPLEAGAKTYEQATAPTAGMNAGDIWFHTADNNKPYRYNGGAWIAMVDPRIGANATAVTDLQTRVTNTENTNSAQATSITNLNSSVAGKADVSAVNSLTTRVDTVESQFNVNLVPNAAYGSDIKHWHHLKDNTSANPNWVVGRNQFWIVDGGVNNFGFYNTGTPAVNQVFNSYTGLIPVDPSIGYFISGSMAFDNLNSGSLRVEAYRADGSYIGSAAAIPFGGAFQGGTTRASWQKSHASFTMFADARFVRIGLAATVSGGLQPRAHVMEVMLERARPGQTSPTPFNRGPVTAYAAWNLSLGVDGYITGVSFGNDGVTSNFVISADNFQIVKPGGGARTEYSDGNWRVYDAAGVLRVRMGVWT